MAWVKTAIITGGTRGIGKETAILLAKKRVNVVICSRNEGEVTLVANELQSNNPYVKISGIKCDVTIAEDVDNLARQVLANFGTIDVLVNNAGTLLVRKLVDTSESEWDRVIDTNLKGAFLCSRAVLPHMTAKNLGTIINVACGAGKVGFENLSAYCASKFGMMGLTESLAWEVANYDNNSIRVMSICPGEVETDMQKEVDLSYYQQQKMLNPRGVADRIKHLIYDDVIYTNGHSEDIFNVVPRYSYVE